MQDENDRPAPRSMPGEPDSFKPNEVLIAGMRMARLAGWIMIALLMSGSMIAASVIHGALTRCECPEYVAPISPYAMIGERLEGVINVGDYAMYDPPSATTATFFSITPVGDVVVRGIAGCVLGRRIVVSVPGTSSLPLKIVDEDKRDGFHVSLVDTRALGLPPHTLTIQPGTSVEFVCDGRRWMFLPIMRSSQ